MTEAQQLKFAINIPTSKINLALKWVAAINIFFLLGTWLSHENIIMPHKYSMQVLLAQFNLAKENIAASWYSSMLLFTIGMAALVCFWVDMQRSENIKGNILNFGWLVMAGIFILLSFDEMGSFHEMIGETTVFKKAGGSKGAGWYAFYALIGVVAIFMITFFVLKFKGNKLAFVLTVLGVLLLVSNPFQEKFEIHTYRSSGDMANWHRPVFFLLLEEGSEIFASFCFLYSFTTYAVSTVPAQLTVAGKIFRVESVLPKNIFLYLAGLGFLLGLAMLIIHLNAWNFQGDDNGIPHNWPPAVTSFIGFAAAIYLYCKFDNPQRKELYLLIAFTALLVSVYYGANIYGYTWGAFAKLKYVMLAVTAITALWSVIQLNSLFTKVLLTAWLLLLAASVFSHRFYPAALGYLAAVCLVLGLFLHYQYKSRQAVA